MFVMGASIALDVAASKKERKNHIAGVDIAVVL
jgi:hypothetical protein